MNISGLNYLDFYLGKTLGINHIPLMDTVSVSEPSELRVRSFFVCAENLNNEDKEMLGRLLKALMWPEETIVMQSLSEVNGPKSVIHLVSGNSDFRYDDSSTSSEAFVCSLQEMRQSPILKKQAWDILQKLIVKTE